MGLRVKCLGAWLRGLEFNIRVQGLDLGCKLQDPG